VVYVSHDINAAVRLADRIVAMKNGRILDESSGSDVLTSAKLKLLYDTEFDVVLHSELALVVTL
jgi:ABC-type enterochelin transport system ATPase subunit